MGPHGGPYFRFEFNSRQHKTLVRLDETLMDEALVRYASPCTHFRKQLEQWQIDREVIENTNFVSPAVRSTSAEPDFAPARLSDAAMV